MICKSLELKRIFIALGSVWLFSACASRGFNPNSQVSGDKKISTAKENMQKLNLGVLDAAEEKSIEQAYQSLAEQPTSAESDAQAFGVCADAMSQIGVPEANRTRVYWRIAYHSRQIFFLSSGKETLEKYLSSLEAKIKKIDGFTGLKNDLQREILFGDKSDLQNNFAKLKDLSCELKELQKAKDETICRARTIENKIATHLSFQYQALSLFADATRYELPDFSALKVQRVQARRYGNELATRLNRHARLLLKKNYPDELKRMNDLYMLEQFESGLRQIADLAQALEVEFNLQEALNTLRDDSRRWRAQWWRGAGAPLSTKDYAVEVRERSRLLRKTIRDVFSRGNVRTTAKDNIVSLEEVMNACTEAELPLTEE